MEEYLKRRDFSVCATRIALKPFTEADMIRFVLYCNNFNVSFIFPHSVYAQVLTFSVNPQALGIIGLMSLRHAHQQLSVWSMLKLCAAVDATAVKANLSLSSSEVVGGRRGARVSQTDRSPTTQSRIIFLCFYNSK
jgi:hypothetical protein